MQINVIFFLNHAPLLAIAPKMIHFARVCPRAREKTCLLIFPKKAVPLHPISKEVGCFFFELTPAR